MTKYEYKMEQKKLKQQRKADRKELKRKKRADKKTKRISRNRFTIWHKVLINSFKVGGPLAGLGYIGYKFYWLFYVNIDDPTVPAIEHNLKYLFLLMFLGMFLFLWLAPIGYAWLKKARQARMTASNMGQASHQYKGLTVDGIAVALMSWPLVILFLFNHIMMEYGPDLNVAFNEIAYAFGIGAGLFVLGSMIQDRVLMTLYNRQKAAEAQKTQQIHEVYEHIQEQKQNT